MAASWLALCAATLAVPAVAGVGDLLVAPTRVVIDGNRGTEVVLNNIGSDTANYRVSLELRRMDATGNLVEVPEAEADAHEKSTLGIISYAPRRVSLPPNQPQAIRIGVRAPADLPDGEYRAHMVFRAIPDAAPLSAPKTNTLSVKLVPIYGVIIPIIVRRGNLQVAAQISDAHLGVLTMKEKDAPKIPVLDLTLTRTGTRSVYGNFRVLRAGVSKPLFEAKGIAVYAEIGKRLVELGLKPALNDEQIAALKGPVTIEYREPDDLGGGLITALQTVLR
jgi:hypothetical protein